MKRALVWMSSDLRLDDNPALFYACKEAEEVLPYFIFSDDSQKFWQRGGASRWWLHHSLTSLKADLKSKGADLYIDSGDPREKLPALAKKMEISAVYTNTSLFPFQKKFYPDIEQSLKLNSIGFKVFEPNLLIEPTQLKTQQGKPYQVYSPFARAAKQQKISSPIEAPKSIPGRQLANNESSIDKLALLPKIPWDAGMKAHWKPGETEARKKLKNFLSSAVFNYEQDRDLPSTEGTSQLSPHLHFGEISSRRIFHSVSSRAKGPQKFINEVLWREFAYYLAFHFPQLSDQNMKKEFDAFPWKDSPKAFQAWKKGATGYPIIDAGMRQLWSIGWMHNRVRMIAASFLVKHLLIHWKEGANWFWDTLVDADLANNSMGWQWVAGSGPDAAPYFRIFNPILQSKKFDPDGNYIRAWIPELALVPKNLIHEPWNLSEEDQRKYAVRMGADYPLPIVDHADARASALSAYDKIRKN